MWIVYQNKILVSSLLNWSIYWPISIYLSVKSLENTSKHLESVQVNTVPCLSQNITQLNSTQNKVMPSCIRTNVKLAGELVSRLNNLCSVLLDGIQWAGHNWLSQIHHIEASEYGLLFMSWLILYIEEMHSKGRCSYWLWNKRTLLDGMHF